MEVVTSSYKLAHHGWSAPLPSIDSDQTLVVFFGAPEVKSSPGVIGELRRRYPKAVMIGCSTSGEIGEGDVSDGSVSVAVARFEATNLQLATAEVSDPAESFSVGALLARKLMSPDLRAIFVLSEGLQVNGSELVRGLNSAVGRNVVITGGLAGDGTAFGNTWVYDGKSMRERVVVAVGMYGQALAVAHGSRGGWTIKGKEHVVTMSKGNVVLELDYRPALEVYEEYLGPEKAKELPASGLLYPLSMRTGDDDKRLTRTLLAIDRAKSSLTFAGDVPMHSKVSVMEADFERLVHGARDAVRTATLRRIPEGTDSLTLAVSCVGRRLLLKENVQAEVSAVSSSLPARSHVVGFYSYGEISPHGIGQCDLHNQTMTLTVLTEDPKLVSSAKMAAAAPAARDSQRPRANMRSTPPARPSLPPPREIVTPAAAPPPALTNEPAPAGGYAGLKAFAIFMAVFAVVAYFLLSR